MKRDVLFRDPPRIVRNVEVCESKDWHDPDGVGACALATQRLFWVTGPVTYCDACAAQMRTVAAALGMTVHGEAIALPADVGPSRGIALEGVPR